MLSGRKAVEQFTVYALIREHTWLAEFASVSRRSTTPSSIRRWTVLRSPHVDKKSREQFELKTHKRLIDILDSRAQTVDALTKLDLPAGVDVEIKVE